jgi:cell division cycle 2-like protein
MDAKSRRGGEIGHEYPNKRSMGVAGTNASPHVYSQAYQQYDAQTHSYVPTSAYNGAYATGISPFNGLASNLGASQSWSHSTMPSDPTSPASGVAYSYYPTYGTEFALPAAATEKLASGEYYDPLAPPEQPRPKALPQNVVKTSHDSTKTGIGSHIRSPVAKVASSGVSASTTSSGAHIRELKDNERSKATPINKAPGALVFSFESSRHTPPPKSTLFQNIQGSQHPAPPIATQSAAPAAIAAPSASRAPAPQKTGPTEQETAAVSPYPRVHHSPVVSSGNQKPPIVPNDQSKPTNQQNDQKSIPALQSAPSTTPRAPPGALPSAAPKKRAPPKSGERTLDTYRIEKEISEGAYGVVYKAVDLFTSETVALKRVKVDPLKEREAGFPLSAVREIRALGFLQHDHVVGFRDLISDASGNNLYLVLDYVEHDLHQLMKRHKGAEPLFSIANVKSLVWQLLTSIAHLHSKDFMHRDIKSSNLLLSSDGKLYLADFGLAKEFQKNGLRTPTVVTISYRAPELAFEAPDYNIAIDMWSVGLIMAELLTGREFLRGIKTQLDLIAKLCEIFGSPNEENYGSGYKKLAIADPKSSISLKPQPVNKLKSFFPTLSRQGFDLLSKMLCYNPETRISAAQALNHPWFKEYPNPVQPSVGSFDIPVAASPSPVSLPNDTSLASATPFPAPSQALNLPLSSFPPSPAPSIPLVDPVPQHRTSNPLPNTHHEPYNSFRPHSEPPSAALRAEPRFPPYSAAPPRDSHPPDYPQYPPTQYPPTHHYSAQNQQHHEGRDRPHYQQHSHKRGSYDRPYSSRAQYPRNGSYRY